MHGAPRISPRQTAADRRSTTEVVVIGAGVAGLSFALRLEPDVSITIITKSELGESNTTYAQGGMAAAVGPDDTPELHLIDTIDAGAGLTDRDAAEGLVERGASAVRWLLKQGARFDLAGNTLQLGQEAAHSRRRILHAGGDATGAEIERALVHRIRNRPNTRIVEYGMAIDLLLTDVQSVGGITLLHPDGTIEAIHTKLTVLANGGAGQLWAVTSNPEDATGDGIAMALRAGAEIADVEFAQFHPTVLNAPGISPFLISEAVRGEGAHLINSAGERFMLAIDERAELAPRNVVAGEIERQLTRIPDNQVFLDLRHLDPAMIDDRFPTIQARLAENGITMAADLIPVAPAAHYFMGGVVADMQGRTSLSGLLAIGEVACTGVHGANRLASNSLLEGLVFGINSADQLMRDGFPAFASVETAFDAPSTISVDVTAARNRIKRIMSEDVGVVRNEAGLRRAIDELEDIPLPGDVRDRASLVVRNMRELSIQIAASALRREESRGGHIRSDFHEADPALEGQHQTLRWDGEGVHRAFGELTPDN